MALVVKSNKAARGNVVKRNVPLRECPAEAACQQALATELGQDVRIEKLSNTMLQLQYDAARLSFSQVLATLDSAGLHPAQTRCFRLRTAWYNFIDANIAAQARARPKPCCNRVPRLK